MTDRDKIAHVLRRLGLGAGRYEVQRYQSFGVQGTIDALIDFDKIDEKFSVSPWSFAVQADMKYYVDSYQMAAWWGLRFLMTRRPLQEKLTLFWHDHFAVSGEKVFEGASMLGYNQILRKHGAGKFRDLLKAVSKHGALLAYLDANTSTKAHPNENFAREMFELFTLGVGNYTEKDVKEAARAFTGWSLHFSGIGDDTPFEAQAEHAARQGMSLFNYCWVPAHHDMGTKTVLGKTGEFTGDDVLDLVADRPETARLVCTKMWEFFAYRSAPPGVVDSLVNVWKATDGSIRSVLKAIVARPEFWSDQAVRATPKCPVDFTVAMFRAMGLSDVLQAMYGTGPKDEYEPVREELRKGGSGAFYLMSQQGMTLLFPPNVGGWEWGDSWITANNTVSRVNHANVIFFGDDPNRPLAQYMANRLKTEDRVTSSAQIVDAMADIFDAPVTPTDRDVLIEACMRFGGVGALGNKDTAAGMLAGLSKLMFALPAFQLC